MPTLSRPARRDPALFLAEGPQRSSVGVTHLLLARALAEGGHGVHP